MAINIQIAVDDQATPVLSALLTELTDLTGLHRVIALDAAEYTRRHIREAATTRHTTATRLGSTPTGYLSKTANTVESEADKDGVTLRVAGAIFKRVAGPVIVRPREKKYLTIPIHKDAVGKKAQELWWNAPTPKRKTNRRRRLIQGLFIVKSKKGNLLLAKSNQDGTITPYYALKTSVTLPQDEGLLPNAKQMGQVAEKAAAWYLQKRIREAGV